MPKQRTHNEWFQPVQKQAYGGGSRCPCGLSRADRVARNLDPQMYAWGEYHATRWSCVDYFCQSCYRSRILPRLTDHVGDCGCTFAFNARSGYCLPDWLVEADREFQTICTVKPTAQREGQLTLAYT